MGRARDLIRRCNIISEGFKLNVANLPLKKAREFAERQFADAGQELDKVLPDFDKNYTELQKRAKAAPNIPRIDMPVIEPQDMEKFETDIKKGRIDIFKPYAFDKPYFPKDLFGDIKRGTDFLSLGQKDGNKKDDMLKAKIVLISASKLKPTQGEIWLEKLITNIINFGIPKAGSSVLNTTIIVSKEGFILDGHHRFGQAQLADPKLKLKSLQVPLDIDTLLKVGRSYGNALGNQQKQ